ISVPSLFANLFPVRSLSRNPTRPGAERLWSIPDFLPGLNNGDNPPAGPVVGILPSVRETSWKPLNWALRAIHRRFASQCSRPTIRAGDLISHDSAGFRPPLWQHPAGNGCSSPAAEPLLDP